jgi:hypothetical protein
MGCNVAIATGCVEREVQELDGFCGVKILF